MGEQRDAQLLVEHEGFGADDVAELGVAAESQGTADVDAPGAVAAAVEAVSPERPGAPAGDAEVMAPVARDEIAVEPAVREVARDAGRHREAAAVDRAAGDPERVVPHVAQVV